MPSSHPTSPQEDSSPDDLSEHIERDDTAAETEIVRLRRKQRRRLRVSRQQLMVGFFAFIALLIAISGVWYMYQWSGY